ncbi:MAG TPA: SBBP repeat-containing protein [Terriglobales bacterium]|nr:SBBP repeat-containing protein [Terriglobales bacterium]
MSLNVTRSVKTTLRNWMFIAAFVCLSLGLELHAQKPATGQQKMAAQLAQLPLAFESNAGQTDARVKFLSRGNGYVLFLTQEEAILSLGTAKAGTPETLRLKLAGANHKAPVTGLEMLSGKTNYFLGADKRQWHTNVANYGKVRYAQVYPGIDLLYYGKQNTLEHDFIVAPGADAGKIAFEVKGARQLRMDEDGNLVLHTRNGQVQLDRPVIYQVGKDGKRQEIAGGFALSGKNHIGFTVGAYDHSRELIIDPVLNYGTYFGGDNTTTANAIAVDTNGNAYFTGHTLSTTLVASPACATCTATPNNDEIFVAKLNASGTAITFLTIIGGSGSDTANAIAIDSAGTPNVYLTGQTTSTNFPTTAGALRTVAGNNAPDAFAIKLQGDGSVLNYATYLNGGAVATDHADIGRGIAVDSGNLIYVTGSTASTTFLPSGFVVGAQLSNADGTGATTDAFIVKINPAGGGTADLQYGTYWGGTVDEVSNAIALVSAHHAIVAGMTTSSDFPVANQFDNSIGGAQDGFIASIPPAGAKITAINCDDDVANNRITITTNYAHGLVSGDDFTVSGVTASAGVTYDGNETAGTGTTGTTIIYTTNNTCGNGEGNQSGGITATSAAVGRRKYSTFLGGDVLDEIKALALDGSGNAYVTGSTTSTTGFPNATFQAAGGGVDAFIAKLSSGGGNLRYSAYYGGAGDDIGNAIAVNKACTAGSANCEIYVAGTTTTAGGFFNTNALQGAKGTGQDAFVARFKNTGALPNGSNAGVALVYSTYFGGAGTDSITGIAATYSTNSAGTNILYIAGNTSSNIGASTSFGSTATVTSSAAQNAPAAGATGTAFVAKLQASDVANPTLAISGVQSPAGSVGQASAPVAFASALTYNWTVTNTAAAKAVTVDIPIPQSGNIDLLTLSGTVITGTGSAGTCTRSVGTTAGLGGVTCNLGDLTASGSTNIAVSAVPSAQAHCANAPCTNIAQVGKVASAETGSLATSGTVTSTVVPVVNLEISGSVTTDVGADAVYAQGSDATATYTVTVTNNSGTTNASVDPTLDVLLTADYPTNFVVTSTTPALTGGALVAGTPACKDNPGLRQVQCTIDTILAAGSSNVIIVGNFTSAASNPALPTFFTTSKFPANNATEIFTATGANTNFAINIGYQALSSDVQVTSVTDNADPVQAGGTLTYTISFRNNGPTDATNAVITSVVDFGFDAQSKPGFCTQSAPGANIVCAVGDIATMAIGDPDLTIDIGGPAPLASTASSLTGNFTSTIAADQFDGTANNVGTQATVIERRATLSITTATSTTPVSVGTAVTLNVTVHNDAASPSSASNVVTTITLPAGFTTIASGTAGCVVASPVVTCTRATLAANADYAIAITANAPTSTTSPAQTLTTTASVNSNGTLDPTGLPHTANIDTVVTRTSDLVLTTATDNSPVRSSGPLTFTTLVTNDGPDPANNVKVAYTLPNANYTLGVHNYGVGQCVQVAAVITCNVTGDIANAGTSANTLSVTPDPAVPGGTASASVNTGIQVFSTTVTDDGAAGAPGVDNAQTVNSTIQREADLTLNGFGGEGFSATPTVSSLGQITYTLAVRNNVGSDTATGINVKFTLAGAGGFAFVGSTGTTGCTITGAGLDELTCSLANLAAGSQTAITVTITPPAGFITVGNSANLDATAEVSGTVIDAVANNTRGPVTTQVQRQADLALTGFVGASFTGTTPVGLASNVTFTLVTRNNGPDDATGVTVVYTLPTGFTYVSDTLGNTCTTPTATTVSCPVGNLANATNTSFNLVITPPAGLVGAGVPSNTFNASATVSSANVFNTPSGNDSTAPVVITVERQSNFDVSGFSATASVSAAGTVTYAVTVNNNGPDDATNVMVAFTLTAGNTFVGTTAVNGCVVTSPTVRTCNIGTVVNGGASPVTFNLQVTPSPTAVPLNSPSAVISGQVTAVTSATVVDKVGGTKTSSVGNTTVERRTDLSLSSFTATPTVNLNGDLVYGLTVDNSGGLDTATNVKVTFTITSGFTFQSTTATGGCVITSATTLDCTVGSITTGVPVSFTATVRAPAGLVGAGAQSATMTGQPTAVFSASIVDGVTGTKSLASLNTTVERQSDLSLNGFGGEGFTATPAVSTAGNITYSLAVRNNGPDNATNVQVTFDLNASGFAFVSTSLGGGCVISTPTQLTCTIGNLANAAQTTFTAVITPPSGFITSGNTANLTANATVLSSSLVDGAANDTRGPVTTAVQRQADLRASGAGTAFTGPVSAINSSANATYNLSVVNGGPDSDDNAVVVFTFTNPVTSLVGSTGLGACSLSTSTTVTCVMPPGFAAATTRSGSITISPDSGTLLASTNSAPFDVVATISSATAFDNGVAGAPGGNNTTATITTTVQRQSDLQLVSKSGPTFVSDGGAVTYTIVVRNNGPDTAGSVRVIDPLPIVTNGGFTLNAGGANFTSPSGPGACSASQLTPQSTVTCMVGALALNQTATITISGVASIDAGSPSETFGNVATVDAASIPGAAPGTNQTAIETNGGNNSNSVFNTTVSRSADLLMTIVNSTPILIGGALDPGGPGTNFVVGTHQAILYDVTVGNNPLSTATVTNAFVQTTLPSTLTFSSSTSGCTAAAQVVTCNVAATLSPGATASVSFIAIPGANLPVSGSNVAITIGPVVNASGNTDVNQSNNIVNNTTTIDRISDLAIVQSQPALPVSVTNSPTTATYVYTWQVTNNGPSNATGVNVVNALPADLQFVSGSWPLVTGTPAGSCTGATSFGATITCNLQTINSGSTVTITVTVRPTLNTALANKLVGNQPAVSGLVQDNIGSNNNSFSSIELRGVTDLQVTITPVQDPAASAGQVLVGNNQVWNVAVRNNGPYPAGSVITLTNSIDPSDPNVAFVSIQAAGGGFFNCGGVTCTLGALAVNATETVVVTTSTPKAAVSGQTTVLTTGAIVTQYSNGATVGSDTTDPTPANNTAAGNVTGQAAADLAVQQNFVSGNTTSIFVAGNKFVVTVSNTAGRSDATNVVLTNSIAINPVNSIPVGGTATGTPSQGTCNAATGLGTTTVTIVCNLGTIPTGASVTVNLALTPQLASGVSNGMTNTPSVVRTEVDPVASNNSAAPIGIQVNTQPPGNQTFSPINPSNGQPIPSVVLTGFIVIPGSTTMTVATSSPNPNFIMPQKYQFGSGNTAANFYTVSNTAAFNSDGIRVCITTPETFFQPSKVRVFLISGGAPLDGTVVSNYDQTIDGSTPERRVCASVATLPSGGSTFVVMEPVNTAPPVGLATATVTSSGGKGSAGSSVTLDGSLVDDPDTFRCIQNGVDAPCIEQNTRVFRWVGNFLDVSAVDPATGLKVIVKDCRQSTPFFDGEPCDRALTSVGLGSSTITLTVFDDFSALNPPAVTQQFTVGTSGGGSGGVVTQSVSVGQTGTFTFTYNYTANTTFALVGTPSLAANGITCTTQPSSLIYTGPVGGSQIANITVLCSTSSPVFAMNNAPGSRQGDGTLLAGFVGLAGLPLVGMVLLPGRSRRHRKLKMLALCALIVLMVIFQAACGGGGTSSFGGGPKQVSQGTAKGDYVIQVNATPAPLIGGNPVKTLTLTVQ